MTPDPTTPRAPSDGDDGDAGDGLTDNQRAMMLHALGLDRRKESYRNAYCVPFGQPEDAEWAELVGRGLAMRGQTINCGRDRYYFVTEQGRQALAKATAGKIGETDK
ncbi:MAG TPA: hypothetical protein VNH18_08135 [Bryobacteraceae bacterium]|nr:hypothetical protein [Bryobacteraceae bacterium]